MQAVEASNFSFTIFEDGSRYKKAYVSLFGKQADETHRRYIASLVEYQDKSEVGHYFHLANGFRSKYIKRVNCICNDKDDKDTILLFVDEIKGFYDEWCERENDYFQYSKNKNEALGILKQFISILRGVVQGLVVLFEKEKYHGNLSDGIAVDDDLKVSFYNMRKNGHENFEDGIAEDIEEVRDMISIWLSREDEFEELRSLRNYQVKFENKALMTNKNYIWAMDDLIFWSRSEKYDFMLTLYYFMISKRNKLPKSFENCFTFDWQSLVPKEENDPLRKVYSRMKPWEEGPRYTKNSHLICFYNRAIEKYNNYASESGGVYCVLSFEKTWEMMEEIFSATQVCFDAIERYMLLDNISEEEISFRAELKTDIDNKSSLPKKSFRVNLFWFYWKSMDEFNSVV